jgi:hypothetical protein
VRGNSEANDPFHFGRIHRRAKTLQTSKAQSHRLLDNQVLTSLAPRGLGCGKAALRYD